MSHRTTATLKDTETCNRCPFTWASHQVMDTRGLRTVLADEIASEPDRFPCATFVPRDPWWIKLLANQLSFRGWLVLAYAALLALGLGIGVEWWRSR